jgi:hypothetical protein
LVFRFASSLSFACSPETGGPGPSPNDKFEDPSQPSPSPSPTPTPSPVPPVPTTSLENENIGTKTRVADLFDRWKILSSVTGGRGGTWADVTRECQGKIELEFALTASGWSVSANRQKYYSGVSDLIDQVGRRLLTEQGNRLSSEEIPNFLQALRALAWQETRWQHYLRYKDWFFVILSGGSYNVLDDWGITQVARSGFSAGELYNTRFFAELGHCGITSTLAYGFLEYYANYLEARGLSCNGGDPMNVLVGAYNRYSSGYSACVNGLSSDPDYRSYQNAAMSGFRNAFTAKPWLGLMGL